MILFAPEIVSMSEARAIAVRAVQRPDAQMILVGERPDGRLKRITVWRWGNDPRRFEVWVDPAGEVVRTVDSTPFEVWAVTRFNGRQQVPSTDGKLIAPWGTVWEGRNDYLFPGVGPAVEVTTEAGDGQPWVEYEMPQAGYYPDSLKTPNALTPAGEAAFGAEVTHRFLKEILGRDGVTNIGRPLDVTIRTGFQYDNAFWAGGLCDCIFLGSGSYQGSGTGFTNLTSLDVVAHEITHGVTQYASWLDYFGEAGGLNEATSDIIGKSVQWWTEAGFPAEVPTPIDPNAWSVGGSIFYVNGQPRPLRWLWKPSLDGRSYDFVNPERMAYDDPHFTSGPLNRWFYWVSTGVPAGYSPYLRKGYPYPIGADKAVRIWYRALVWYLQTDASYASAASNAHDAAVDLYGAFSREVAAVDFAFAAVNAIPADGLPPSVVSISDTAAEPGRTLLIEGSGFTPEAKAFVGDTAVQVIPANDGQLQIVVPDAPGGLVRVQNANGISVEGPVLTINQAPIIQALTVSPAAFLLGDQVTVTWAVERAAVVKMNGFTVSPTGHAVYTPGGTTDFKLEAWGVSNAYTAASVTAAMRFTDLDADGKTTLMDALEVEAHWGEAGLTDLNGDGVTDVVDLNTVLSRVQP